MEKVLQNKDDGNEMEPEKETAITPETLKVVEENCRKITNETCVKLCIMKKLGVIDERGWYVESKGTEFIKSIFPTDVIIDNQESIFQQIAQTCNRVNKHVSNNCHRGEEVAKCLNEEMEKVLHNNNNGKETEPAEKPLIDERGWYVESKGTEYMNVINIQMAIPTDMIINNQETQFYQIAKECNRVNKHVSNNCHRGEEVATCLIDEVKKEWANYQKTFKEMLDVCEKQTCPELCVFDRSGFLNENGHYAQHEMMRWVRYWAFKTRGLITETEANDIAKKCIRKNKRFTEDCDRAQEIYECLRLRAKNPK
ncbi:uncharacterized protein LOC134798926 isoform X2 [Cydia splendana]|uniref:uncharacterized protein LOC134798926 isoform X2 n=1 Tax=Cydia splendana TaxID=1100963 RepID=UPI00300C6A25